jgi:acetylornithine deacetylase/succinyl-diaminopimelate desuccinylase family protein
MEEKIDSVWCVKLLEALVRINSVNPFESKTVGESEIADYLGSVLKSLGMKTETQEVSENRRNLVATLKGSGAGQSLMFNGHLDTVGVGGMSIDPFKPTIDEKNRLHGRGACDMKGALAAMATAVKSIVDSGTELSGDLLVSGVVDEEYRSIGMSELVKEYRTDAALVGEPTDMKVGVACKGYAWIKVRVHGKLAHGSVPERGVNAIQKSNRLIGEIASLQERYAEVRHPLLGSPKIMVSMIEGGTEWSVVPHFCNLKIERRLLPGESSLKALQEIQDIVNRLSIQDSEFRADVKKVFDQKPMEVSDRELIVAKLVQIINEVIGTVQIIGTPYWTDAALLVNDARIPSCIFGPGNIEVAHSPDEFVALDDVVSAASVYSNTAKSFCGVI